jgi:type VI secretion system protein ImpH
VLGFGAVAGDEIWDCQSRARILLGPLDAARYRDFLPDGACFEALGAITRFFSGHDVEFELELILKREDVPPCELGDDAGFTQLGWFTWIKSNPGFQRDPCDTVLLFAGGEEKR